MILASHQGIPHAWDSRAWNYHAKDSNAWDSHADDQSGRPKNFSQRERS